MNGLTAEWASAEIEKLQSYASLVLKWGKSINLIANSTKADIWQRHILDSVQVVNLIPKDARNVLDVGSGGGLPGIVAAIRGESCGYNVTMVERDKRKSVFLSQAIRELELRADVINDDILALEPQQSEVLTARAFASLEKIIPIVDKHVSPRGLAILPKGKEWKTELEVAQKEWHFECTAIPSKTDSSAAVLTIQGLSRVK